MNVNVLQNLFAAIANSQANSTNTASNNINNDNNSCCSSNNVTDQNNTAPSSTTLPLPVAPSSANSKDTNNMSTLS